MGMKLAALSQQPKDKSSKANACFIDMIQTARPGGACKQGCIHCGASKEGGEKQVQLTREELEENLTRRIRPLRNLRKGNRLTGLEEAEELDTRISEEMEEARGKIVASYLAPYVTTDVDVEPTDGDAFIDAAELINDLTFGQSRMLCISHGIRSGYCIDQGHLRDVRQIFSLFGYHNAERYSDGEWKKCFSNLEGWGLPEDVEEKVYSAFVNNLKMQLIRGELGDPETNGMGDLVDKIKEMGLPKSLQRRFYRYCQEGGLEDSNLLMINQLAVTDALVEEGMLNETCSDHGKQSAERTEKIVEMMREGAIPGFILTVDFARSHGKINLENNMASYVKTLKLLKPALSEDCSAFVAVSIQGLQGDDVPSDNPYTAERAHIFFQQVLERAGLTREERKNLQFDIGRQYAEVGGAAEDPLLSDFLSSEGKCEVIPHQQFVDKVVAPQRKLSRARLRADGAIERQFVEDGATYNTTVEGPWEPLLDAPAIREYENRRVMRALESEIGTVVLLTKKERARKREMNWEGDIEKENDIFMIQPFSALEREDRERALDLVRGMLGVADVRDYLIKDGETERNIRFTDLKLELLRRYYPSEKNVDVIVAQSGPYIETVERLSERGLDVGAALSQENWYAGEMLVVAKVLEEGLDIDYLRDRLEEVYLNRAKVEDSVAESAVASVLEEDVVEAGEVLGSAEFDEEEVGAHLHYAVRLPDEYDIDFGVKNPDGLEFGSSDKEEDGLIEMGEGSDDFDEDVDTDTDEMATIPSEETPLT